MTADVWVHVAEAVREKLLLSSEPSHRSVGEYNAMDIARGFAARAENTLLNRCLPPTDRLWKYVLRSQQGIADYYGISNVADVHHLCERLQTCVQPLTPESTYSSGHMDWLARVVLRTASGTEACRHWTKWCGKSSAIARAASSAGRSHCATRASRQEDQFHILFLGGHLAGTAP